MITKDQALTLNEFHDDAPSHRRDGSCYVWRRNGRTQTWKTRPDDWRVPVKYGLREYAQLTPSSPVHVPGSADCPMRRRELAASE